MGTFCSAAFEKHLFSSCIVRTDGCFIYISQDPGVWSSLERIGMSTKYHHFNASLLARKQFPAFALHLIPPSHCLFSTSPLINEVVSQTGGLNILNITVPYGHLSLSHSFSSFLIAFLSYSPFYSLFFSQEVDVPDRC